ncbi:MAG: hypothetical protein M3Y64_09175 [Gemmatimonadota bacterium]|nr:hypothetical protein [Gemmatimonadota bacterium]
MIAFISSCFVSAACVHAQGGQKYGFQVAGLATSIGSGSGAVSGAGVETQLRANTLYASEVFALSLGIGGQLTSHTSGSDKIVISGIFLEPRWVPHTPLERVFPYVSGRLSYLRQSSNFGSASTGPGFGAGFGLAVLLTKTLNLDAGVALVRQQFGDFNFNASDSRGSVGTFEPFTTYAAKIGLSLGFPNR